MISKCKLLGFFTFNQASVLKTLYESNLEDPSKLMTAQQMGSKRQTHHLKSLQYLEKNGFVIKMYIEDKAFYKISEKGIQEYSNFKFISDLNPSSVLGTSLDRNRATLAFNLTHGAV